MTGRNKKNQTKVVAIESPEQFDRQVDESQVPVLAYFGSKWCAHCQDLWPIIQRIAVEYNGKIKVLHVDVDKLGDLADELEVEVVPTLLLFQGGEIIEQLEGLGEGEELKDMVEEHLSL